MDSADISRKIENELGAQWIGSPSNKVPNLAEGQYMDQLKACARSNGIDVPLTANAPNMVSFIHHSAVFANVRRTLYHGRRTIPIIIWVGIGW